MANISENDIRIINISGQPVLTKQSGISKGYNTLQVDGLSQLPTGVYVAEVAVNGVIILLNLAFPI